MSEPKRTWNLSYAALVAATLWLAAIALAKLVAGNPGDLPKVVLETSPFGETVTFAVAISIELAIALFALARPKVGWFLLTGLFLVFEAVLASLIASGAKSCGCAGGAISIPPVLMAAIDGVLLLALLATQPWKRMAGPAVHAAVVAVGLVVLAVVPWMVVSGRSSGPSASFIVIHPERWVGQVVYDVQELKDHLAPGDVEKLPTDGLVLLWRQSCEHCRDHLRNLANDAQLNDGTHPIVLLQIQDDLKNAPVVDAMPEGPHVTKLQFPVGPDFAIQTPWELHVEGGVVVKALDEEHAKSEHGEK
ncbi:MAG: hypothetical protein U1F29_03400 [Planctomycetota bacterium]